MKADLIKKDVQIAIDLYVEFLKSMDSDFISSIHGGN